MPRSFNIVVHDLGLSPQQHVRVLIGQPTYAADDWTTRNDLYFARDIRSFRERIQGFIVEAVNSTADLIVLPELSVPLEAIDLLRSWSEQTGGVAVAGSHYFLSDGAYRSRCPIMISGDVFFTEKLTPAPAEVSPVNGQGLSPGRVVHVFKNTRIGDFAVLICSDYLDAELRQALFQYDIGLLCVPSCQRNSAVYHARMGINCEESERGLYIAYSNMVHADLADGRSAFFGTMDRLFTEKLLQTRITDLVPPQKLCELSVGEDSLILEADMENRRPRLGRTIFSRPNISVIKHGEGKAAEHTRFLRLIGHADDRYRYISDLYVEPEEYPSMLARLEKDKLLFIVGDPGIGKTYTAARILRRYFDAGYEPVWFTGIEKEERLIQRQTLEQYAPKDKQIIYFEDPFGRTTFEKRDAIYTVFGPLIDRLRSVDARVIVTSRKEVFERFSTESLTAKELTSFKEEMGVMKPSYSAVQMLAIWVKLARGRCKWFGEERFRRVVERAVFGKRLSTPLALRDLVFSAEDVVSVEDLERRISRRQIESALIFAGEIESLPLGTKLAFALICLGGEQNQQILATWFSKAQKEMASMSSDGQTKGSFVEELRTQLGFRVEQFGASLSALRFSHPVYEEAVIQLAVRDSEMGGVFSSVLNIMREADYRLTVNAVFRSGKRFPEITELLCSELLKQKRQTSVKDLVTLGMKMVAADAANHDRRFESLLRKVCSPSELGEWISTARERALLTYVFRFAAHYVNYFNENVSAHVKWGTVFSGLSEKTGLGYLIETLEWAAKVDARKVADFMLSLSVGDLRRGVEQLPVYLKERFVRLAKHTQLERGIETFVRNYRIASAQLHAARRGRMMSVSAEKAVVVDDGASKALRRRGSLLPVGIKGTVGKFGEGELIAVLDGNAKIIGVGIAHYNSDDVRKISGRQSGEIGGVLDRFNGVTVIHADRFALKE